MRKISKKTTITDSDDTENSY